MSGSIFADTISAIADEEDGKIFIKSINSILRRGRKAKIVLILASHDPTSKNTKVNINTIVARIAFQLAKPSSSQTALGVTGAQSLPGEGAMLFRSQSGIKHLQGAYVTEVEIERILKDGPQDYESSEKLQVIEPENEFDKKIAKIRELRVVDFTVQKANKELAGIGYRYEWPGADSIGDAGVHIHRGRRRSGEGQGKKRAGCQCENQRFVCRAIGGG